MTVCLKAPPSKCGSRERWYISWDAGWERSGTDEEVVVVNIV